MTNPQVAQTPSVPRDREPLIGERLGAVVLEIDFRSRWRERVYDSDKIWSGEHTILDYTEM